GGIGTPIGTPPNAIALKYLTGDAAVSFGAWMGFGVPYVLVMLFIGWRLLLWLFPIATPAIKLAIKGRFLQTSKARLVYVTFAGTILLWLTDFLHGMNSYTVAMLPVGVFLAFGIINKDDLKKISWDVLWLVAGGIALGLGLERSGLSVHLVGEIPFAEFSPLLIFFIAAVLTMVMANFMSHTASANLLMPIIAALGVSLESMTEIGGVKALIIGVALSASLGMALPISTPPNALAHATGLLETKDMAKAGVPIALIGLVLVFVTIYLMRLTGFV
ncbi:MAG: dihydroorotate dehydrogenase, partial [Bacteroidetes bacterium]